MNHSTDPSLQFAIEITYIKSALDKAYNNQTKGKTDTAHNALADALTQIRQLLRWHDEQFGPSLLPSPTASFTITPTKEPTSS